MQSPATDFLWLLLLRQSSRVCFDVAVLPLLPVMAPFIVTQDGTVVEENMDVDTTNLDDVLLQFGRIGDDTFHLDFRTPLTAFQALGIAMAQFNF